ncbi:MAG: hypothetical protein AAF357_00420 [Verrucomicrobiota bacterium]
MKAIRTALVIGAFNLSPVRSAEEPDPTQLLLTSGEKSTPVRSDLVAHEWGTFTQVIGSDGGTIPWWIPYSEGPTVLPEFVKPVIHVMRKTGIRAWKMRMETPVIYFYADREADLMVTVDESKVPLTEVYPNVSNPLLSLPSEIDPIQAITGRSVASPISNESPFLRRWDLQILPPENEIGTFMLPVGTRGDHYRYAREVPDAWWVVKRGGNPELPPEVEKFVFYRGAGDGSMPHRIARVQEETVVFWKSDQPVFLVETDGETVRWIRVIPTSADEESGTAEFEHPSANPNALSDADALAEALITDLDEAGLTPEEASAMVATWEEAWLGEPGFRVLEILPREWVDETLPLTISPTPGKVERVFVARWELIGPELEREVLGILTQDASMEDKKSSLRNLDLGRFSTAVFDRVATIRDRQFRAKYRGWMTELNRSEAEEENDAVAAAAP